MLKPTLRAAALAVLLAAPLSAQRLDPHSQPPRPTLWAGADSNSAAAYYTAGVQRIDTDPAGAAAAFYWAERLHPGWADALYGRRVALLLQLSEERYMRYMEGQRSVTRAADITAIDSLYVRALTADPFLYRKFEQQMFRRYWHAVFADDARRSGGQPNTALFNDWLNTYLHDIDPDVRGYVAYSEGRWPEAQQWLERASQRAGHHRSRVRSDLARVLYMEGDRQRSAEVMSQAIEDMRSEDARDLVFVYESKAVLEQSVATAREELGDHAAAREAYGRALQEDIAFYPAHQALGKLALAAGDTSAAVAELALAAQIAVDDGGVAYDYANLLANTGKVAEALPELERAVRLDPYYAAPHLLLARIYDASGMRTEAVQHYHDFAARAAHDDPGLEFANRRAAEIEAALHAEAGNGR